MALTGLPAMAVSSPVVFSWPDRSTWVIVLAKMLVVAQGIVGVRQRAGAGRFGLGLGVLDVTSQSVADSGVERAQCEEPSEPEVG